MAGTVALWYRRKYNLPPNHPLYLAMSEQEMLVEFYAHHYDDLKWQGKSIDEAETENWDEEVEEFLKDSKPDDWETVVDE